jgi:hypothetical protein
MCGFGGFFRQQKIEKLKFKAICLIHILQILFVVLLGAVDGDFHKLYSSDFRVKLA